MGGPGGGSGGAPVRRTTIERLGQVVEAWTLLRGARSVTVPALLPVEVPTGRDLHGHDRISPADLGHRVALPDTVCQVVLAALPPPDRGAPVVVSAQGVAFGRAGAHGSLTARVLREVIAVGSHSDVDLVLDTYTALTAELAACLGLAVERVARGPRGLRLRVTEGRDALVAAQFHDGPAQDHWPAPAAAHRSGCVAIDLTLLHQLLRERFAGDPESISAAVERARGEVGRR